VDAGPADDFTGSYQGILVYEFNCPATAPVDHTIDDNEVFSVNQSAAP
jgi:hypothetical protein